MTIAYNADIATSRWWSFLLVICRWRASVWRSVLFEFCLWTLLYYVVFAFCHMVLVGEWKRDFFQLATQLDDRLDGIFPLNFILGFYVTLVVSRWKKAFDNIAPTDNVCFALNSYVRGKDEKTRLTRRCIARWLCLCQVLVLRDISTRVRSRFPTLDSLVEGHLVEPDEEKPALEEAALLGHPPYWIPLNWIFTALARLRESGTIKADSLQAKIVIEVKQFSDNMQALCNFDWLPVPLAYSQVVSLAVRAYFLLCLISRQFFYGQLDHHDYEGFSAPENYGKFNYCVPLRTMIQLVIYMGWLRVAEALLNPMGDDDDDFECNYIIDRNITVSKLLVDRYNDNMPQLKEVERGYDSKCPEVPLYSEEAAAIPQHPLVGSAAQAATTGYHHGHGSLREKHEPVRMVPRSNAFPNRKTTADSISQKQQQPTSDYLRKSSVCSERLSEMWKSLNACPLRLTQKISSASQMEKVEEGGSNGKKIPTEERVDTPRKRRFSLAGIL